jgi:hypothetical protein
MKFRQVELQIKNLSKAIHSSSIQTVAIVVITSLINFSMPVLLARTWSLGEFSTFMGVWNVVSLISLWFVGLQVTVTFLTQESSSILGRPGLDRFTKTSFLFFLGVTLFAIPSAIALNLASGNRIFQCFILITTIFSSGLLAIGFGRILGRGQLKRFYEINLVLVLLKGVIVAIALGANLSVVETLSLLLLKQMIAGLVLLVITSRYNTLEVSIFQSRPLSIFFATGAVWTIVYLDVPFLNVLIGTEATGKYASASSLAKGWIILIGFLATYISSTTLQKDKLISRLVWSRYLYLTILGLNLMFAFIAFFLGDQVITFIQGDKFQGSGLLFTKLLLSYNCYAILLVYIIRNREHIEKALFALMFPLLSIPVYSLLHNSASIDLFLIVFSIAPLLSLFLMKARIKSLPKFV